MNKVVDMNNKKPKKGNNEQVQEDTDEKYEPHPLDRFNQTICKTKFMTQAIAGLMGGDVLTEDYAFGCQLIMEDISSELIEIRDLLENKI